MTKLIQTIGAAVTATFGFAAVQSAAAQGQVVVYGEPEPAATRHVSYVDLDLATNNGERKLIRRVRAAVNQVCAEELGPSAIHYVRTSCRNLTWDETEPQLGRAMSRARQRAAINGSPIAATAIIVRAAR